jgi:uncharacterized protein YkwD
MKSLVIIPILILLFDLIDAKSPTDEICLSAEEQKLYKMIMVYRKSKKLDPIPLSAKMTKVAQTHARDLSHNYTFDVKNRCNPHSWSKKGKWTACCYTNDHKEASCMWNKPKELTGYAGNGYEIAYYSSGGANAQEGLDGWKLSPGHNPLLINSGIWADMKWQAIGIAIYKEYGLVWFGDAADQEQVNECQ